MEAGHHHQVISRLNIIYMRAEPLPHSHLARAEKELRPIGVWSGVSLHSVNHQSHSLSRRLKEIYICEHNTGTL